MIPNPNVTRSEVIGPWSFPRPDFDCRSWWVRRAHFEQDRSARRGFGGLLNDHNEGARYLWYSVEMVPWEHSREAYGKCPILGLHTCSHKLSRLPASNQRSFTSLHSSPSLSLNEHVLGHTWMHVIFALHVSAKGCSSRSRNVSQLHNYTHNNMSSFAPSSRRSSMASMTMKRPFDPAQLFGEPAFSDVTVKFLGREFRVKVAWMMIDFKRCEHLVYIALR